jgi:CTP synthase
MAIVEFARNVCGLKGANTMEVDKGCEHPVVHIMESQKGVENKGGTMRLGACKAYIKKGTRVFDLYGSDEVSERHRHRFEVNPKYHEVLEGKGLVLSGISPDGTLVEFIELKDHPYFVATQAHPELKSSLLNPAPLFRGFVEAAMRNSNF